MIWRCVAYLLLGPAYLAAASGVFLGVRLLASLVTSSHTNQFAVALIGTGIALIGSIKLIARIDD